MTILDPGQVRRALTVIGNAAKPAALIREKNAVAYDPNAGWQEGDILPGRLVSRASAKGSAADNDWANGSWKDCAYNVVDCGVLHIAQGSEPP